MVFQPSKKLLNKINKKIHCKKKSWNVFFGGQQIFDFWNMWGTFSKTRPQICGTFFVLEPNNLWNMLCTLHGLLQESQGMPRQTELLQHRMWPSLRLFPLQSRATWMRVAAVAVVRGLLNAHH